MSIADLMCFEEIIQIEAWNLMGNNYIENNYKNIHHWLQRMKTVKGFQKIHKLLYDMIPFIEKRMKYINENLPSKL